MVPAITLRLSTSIFVNVRPLILNKDININLIIL